MKRVLRWIGFAFASVAGLAVIAYAVLYVLSEQALNRNYPVPAVTLSIPTDAESIQEGRRLATVRGCLPGCHGKAGEGEVMFDQPIVARVVAPNLTVAAKKFSAAELAGIIRNGVRPDGRSMLVMPSQTYAALTDADLARIIAFLKTLQEVPGPGPSIAPGPIGRLGLAIGKFKMAARHIAEDAAPAPATGEPAKQGRYLAQTICSECHGASLRGDSNPDFTSPDLRMVSAYSPEAFARLLRTGIALGDRNVGVMTTQSKNNLLRLTDAEIAALYSYLHSFP
jgi:mono/diheme cytochrome c family protein